MPEAIPVKEGLSGDFNDFLFNSACGKCGKQMYWYRTYNPKYPDGFWIGSCCGTIFHMHTRTRVRISAGGSVPMEEEKNYFVPSKVIMTVQSGQ